MTTARVPGVASHLERLVEHLRVVLTLCFVLPPAIPLSSESFHSYPNTDDTHMHSYTHVIYIYVLTYIYIYISNTYL